MNSVYDTVPHGDEQMMTDNIMDEHLIATIRK